MIVHSIAREFSSEPGARLRREGPNSGEEFRETCLVPWLRYGTPFTLDLDHAAYGVSFLEEAFGGLIRHHGYSSDYILRRIVFRATEEPHLVEDIIGYMAAAKPEKPPTVLTLPFNGLIVLHGPSGSGKSTFARQHFLSTAIVSSDFCRGAVSDDEGDQSVHEEAFALFHTWIEQRLKLGKLVVADATNLTERAQENLFKLGNRFNVPVIVLAFTTPREQCWDWAAKRSYKRYVAPSVISAQHDRASKGVIHDTAVQKGQSIDVIPVDPRESYNIVLDNPNIIDAPNGIDIISDVHGCFREFRELLMKLGYGIYTGKHPRGRQLVLVGDLCDRGPESAFVLNKVMDLVTDANAKTVRGNHCDKLRRALKGNNVRIGNALKATLEDVKQRCRQDDVMDFLESLPYQLTFRVPNNLDIVVCHAGIPYHYVGVKNKAVEAHCLYGETTGEQTPDGYSARGVTWRRSWDDKPALCVYGHTYEKEPVVDGNTVCIDTGCFKGPGYSLTAFRYPEREFVSVPSQQPASDEDALR